MSYHSIMLHRLFTFKQKGSSMNAGYVRLSKDDDKKNYVSIENQKLIMASPSIAGTKMTAFPAMSLTDRDFSK